jgi:hypothetical protein
MPTASLAEGVFCMRRTGSRPTIKSGKQKLPQGRMVQTLRPFLLLGCHWLREKK